MPTQRVYLPTFCLPLLAVLLQTSVHAANSALNAPVQLKFPNSPTQRDVPRIGLNMGGWTFYGAEQIMSNVLKNPGFEGRIDRIVLQARKPIYALSKTTMNGPALPTTSGMVPISR